MGIEVLQGNIIHDACHDLESFYWLLVWLVLRHTDHEHEAGNLACSRLFDADNEWSCQDSKVAWLRKPGSVKVRGNAPLTHLLEEFTTQCFLNIPQHKYVPLVPLTHKSVLGLFDMALGMDGWPKNDVARPYKMPNTTATRVDVRPPPQTTSGKTGSKPPSSRSRPLSAAGRPPRSQCGGRLVPTTGSLAQGETSGQEKSASKASQPRKCTPNTAEQGVESFRPQPMIASTNSWSLMPSAAWPVTSSVVQGSVRSRQVITSQVSPTSSTKRTRDVVEKENHSPSKRRKSANARKCTIDDV